MSRFILLMVFVVVLQIAGYLIGANFPVDDWYQALNKPFFAPPGWVFGLVWSILYLLIAIAGWRVLIAEGQTPGWGLWIAQMLMNWAWPPLFFSAHMIFWAMLLLFANLMTALYFTTTTWDRDRLAALCFVPYVGWLGLGLLLNFSIWLLN